MNFGMNLAIIRNKRKMTQEQLAYLIGVSKQTIYKWEYNISTPNINKLEKLIEVLNVNLEDLLL